MYNFGQIDNIKREIRKLFKKSLGNQTNSKLALIDLGKYFNIPIDSTRIDDYQIKSFDYNIPFMEIEDKRDKTQYRSIYTGVAELLNYFGPEQFNNVTSISPKKKEENLYYIGSDKPIISVMTFTDGEYEMIFERETPNNFRVVSNNGVKMAIRYCQNLEVQDEKVKQPLLNKIFKQIYQDDMVSGVFEQVYTYGSENYIKWHDCFSKYSGLERDSVIYGVNEFIKKGFCNYMHGVCFENMSVPINPYLPSQIDFMTYPLLEDNNIKSTIIFKFGTGENLHHELQIYKSDNIRILFNTKKIHINRQSFKINKEIICNEDYSLPILDNGNITSAEIQAILSSLNSRIKDEIALEIISNELNTFRTKIDIRKGLVSEKLDELSPQKFIDKSFADIATLISSQKKEYFQLIKNQFEKVANINYEEGQTRVLKSNNK